jgi:hypothetical protein
MLVDAYEQMLMPKAVPNTMTDSRYSYAKYASVHKAFGRIEKWTLSRQEHVNLGPFNVAYSCHDGK